MTSKQYALEKRSMLECAISNLEGIFLKDLDNVILMK